MAGLAMCVYECSEDEAFAWGFYKLVEANLYYERYRENEDDVETIKVPVSFGLDLFTMRGRFLGCVYCNIGCKVAGLYCLTEKDGKAYVDSGWVAYEQRGKGIGRKLLQLACDKLIKMKKTPINFVVRSETMDRLINKLAPTYPAGTLHKEAVGYDPALANLKDFLFTKEERALNPGS